MSFISAGNTTTTTLLINGDTTGNLVFNTGGANTTALTITNAQNIGIGTSAPTVSLDVSSSLGTAFQVSGANSSTSAYYNGARFVLRNSNATANNFTSMSFQGANGNDTAAIWCINTVQTAGAVSGNLVFGTANAGAAATESMRIDSAGNLLVGQTSVSLAAKSAFTTTGGATGNITMRNSANTGGKYYKVGATADASPYFVIYNESEVGVYIAPGGTAWQAGSDETTKDIIEPILDAVNKVSSLRSVIGKYKTDEEGTRRSFLIAQDVQKVLPEAVTVSPAGTLGLAYTDTIPLLVAAIKELNAKVDAQAAEIAALKAGA